MVEIKKLNLCASDRKGTRQIHFKKKIEQNLMIGGGKEIGLTS